MSSVDIVSVEDIHRIAFLTIHGWELTCDSWTKDGFLLSCESRHEQRWHCLEDAYWAQREALRPTPEEPSR